MNQYSLKIKILIAYLVILIFNFSCSNDNLLLGLNEEACISTNTVPVINSITVSPDPMDPGTKVSVSVNASDFDSQALTYSYSAVNGTITSDGLYNATSPSGPYNVSVSVSDNTVCGVVSQNVALPSWYYMSNFGTAVSGQGLVVYNNKIYSYGGRDSINFQQNMYIYDPQSKTSNSGGSTTALGRQYASMVLIGSKIYIYGGYNAAPTGPTTKANDIIIYDTLTQTWNTTVNPINPPTSGRYYHTAVAYNNKMYVYGGLIDNTNTGTCATAPTTYCSMPTDELWEYDPAINTWTFIGNSGIVGFAQRAVLVGNEMYVYRSASAVGVSSNDFQKYNFISMTWTTLGSLTSPHDTYAPSLVYLPEFPDSIYLYGGYSFNYASTNPYLNELWVYSISQNKWKQLSSGASPRYHTAAVGLNGKMYIFGGLYVVSGLKYFLNDMWLYDPLTDPLR